MRFVAVLVLVSLIYCATAQQTGAPPKTWVRILPSSYLPISVQIFTGDLKRVLAEYYVSYPKDDQGDDDNYGYQLIDSGKIVLRFFSEGMSIRNYTFEALANTRVTFYTARKDLCLFCYAGDTLYFSTRRSNQTECVLFQ